MSIFRKIFGGKPITTKSVNDVRGKTKRFRSANDPLETRIAARRRGNLKAAEIKAVLAAAPVLPRPNIADAVLSAEKLIRQPASREKKAAIDRALRLKGSDRVIRETLSHPLRQYIGLAIVRGLMECGENGRTGNTPK
jgi:hypothetical protein